MHLSRHGLLIYRDNASFNWITLEFAPVCIVCAHIDPQLLLPFVDIFSTIVTDTIITTLNFLILTSVTYNGRKLSRPSRVVSTRGMIFWWPPYLNSLICMLPLIFLSTRTMCHVNLLLRSLLAFLNWIVNFKLPFYRFLSRPTLFMNMTGVICC